MVGGLALQKERSERMAIKGYPVPMTEHTIHANGTDFWYAEAGVGSRYCCCTAVRSKRPVVVRTQIELGLTSTVLQPKLRRHPFRYTRGRASPEDPPVS